MRRARSRSNETIKNFLKKQKLIYKYGGTLRLQLQGFGSRGGYLSTMARLRKKYPKQLKRIPTSYHKLTENGA